MKKISIKKCIFMTFLAIAIGYSAPTFADEPQTPAVSQKPAYEYPTKKPISRRTLAKKFIKAMLCVGASSVIIYIMLSMYNKVMYGSSGQYKASDLAEDNSYKTPNNMKDALDIFLKKTK